MSKQHKSYRRKEKTDYNKRLNLLKSGLPRLVIRMSQKNIYAQLVEYSPEGDRVICTASSKNIEKLGWKASRKNLSAAYLTGLLIAKKAKVKKAILDIGLRHSVTHSRIYSLVKGVNDGGLEIPVNEEMYPDQKRIEGEHISKYAQSLSKENQDKMFSRYQKNKIKPEELQKHFNDIKLKIEGVN